MKNKHATIHVERNVCNGGEGNCVRSTVHHDVPKPLPYSDEKTAVQLSVADMSHMAYSGVQLEIWMSIRDLAQRHHHRRRRRRTITAAAAAAATAPSIALLLCNWYWECVE